MYRIGIDLGGTNIVSGVVDENYKIVGVGKLKTNLPRSAEAIAEDMAKTVFMACENAGITLADIDSIGIGSPGAIDPDNGIVRYAANLDFKDVELCKLVSSHLGKEVFVENDANAAAYGEYVAGAGRGTKNFIAITLGTGLGGGVIVDGKIYSGTNHAGTELGHMVIQMNGEVCTCGRCGCWEAYSSATALIRQTKQAMVRYPKSALWEVSPTLAEVNGLTPFLANEKGDYAAKQVLDKYFEYLAIGLANMVIIFQPEVIAIGGGISGQKDNLVNPVKAIIDGENFARGIEPECQIKVAELGNDAGIIGAAYISDLYRK